MCCYCLLFGTCVVIMLLCLLYYLCVCVVLNCCMYWFVRCVLMYFLNGPPNWLYVSLNCVMYLFLILEQRNVFIRGLIVLFMERPPDLEVDCGLGQEIVADHVLPGVYTCVCVFVYIYIYIYTHTCMYVDMCMYIDCYLSFSGVSGEPLHWPKVIWKTWETTQISIVCLS